MSSLRELQENFKAYILNQNQEILSILDARNDNANRIDIYKKGYSLRLLEILEKDFPTFRSIVGEKEFEKMGYDYIAKFPSTHFSICIFSQYFSQYLLESNYDPYLSEFAAFEWALACALDAADAAEIGVDCLGTVAPESWPYVQFSFHPSVMLNQYFYNAPQIVYAKMMEQENLPELIRQNTSTSWLIWRYQLKSYFESLTSNQVWIVKAIWEGKTFGEICEGLCQWLPEEEVAQFAAGSLHNWLSKGMFSAIQILS